MSKREDSSLILRNLKKVALPSLGQPVVPLDRAEKELAISRSPAGENIAALSNNTDEDNSITRDSSLDSIDDISADIKEMPKGTTAPPPQAAVRRNTRLQPKRRAVRTALIVRLDPDLHRQLDEVARFNSLTMNDIVTEAIELHLRDFDHPPQYSKRLER